MGLGMTVSAVDTLFQQGGLETTGQITDLAIQGSGFFILSDGNGQFYTRAGAFGFDAESFLVDPGSGFTIIGLGGGLIALLAGFLGFFSLFFKRIFRFLRKHIKPILVILNQIDLYTPEQLERLIGVIRGERLAVESGEQGDNLSPLPPPRRRLHDALFGDPAGTDGCALRELSDRRRDVHRSSE